MSEKTYLLMATIPPRQEKMRDVVNSLYKQVDEMRIIFNEYQSIPDWVKNYPKIKPYLNTHDKYTSNAVWLCMDGIDGYVFVCDDDILYPDDYVEKMKATLNKYHKQVLVCAHGDVAPRPFRGYLEGVHCIHYEKANDKDRIVDVCGAGTSLFHTETMRPSIETCPDAHIRDLWLSVVAAKKNIPIVRIQSVDGWLKRYECKGTPHIKSTWRQVETIRTQRHHIWNNILVPELKRRHISIRAFNGIGDLLFITPTLEKIKKKYPNTIIKINTNKPSLLQNNPYVDIISKDNTGFICKYPDPFSRIRPKQHLILEDWELLCEEFCLDIEKPSLVPQLFIDNLPPVREVIGVQTNHKYQFSDKKVWHLFNELAEMDGFEAIPEIKSNEPHADLVRQVASYKFCVCAEGGIQHICAALNKPAVVLYGGFIRPEHTSYDFHVDLVSTLQCSDCYTELPCKRNRRCWDEITMEVVLEAVERLSAAL